MRAVKHLNPGKFGGACGVMSDSVIHGTNMLFVYITCLFNSMLRHGISLDEFLVSILIPIPKDIESTQGTVAITEQLH